MKFRVYFELDGGEEDSIIISGETLKDIQKQVADEMLRRGGETVWSEELHD